MRLVMLYTNDVAVFAAAVGGVVFALLWYGPLFGKTLSRQSASGPGKRNKPQERYLRAELSSYFFMFVGLLLMAFTLSHLISLLVLYSGFTSVVAGLEGALMGYFGFALPASIGFAVWSEEGRKAWLVHSGYGFVALMLMGIIIGGWM